MLKDILPGNISKLLQLKVIFSITALYGRFVTKELEQACPWKIHCFLFPCQAKLLVSKIFFVSSRRLINKLKVLLKRSFYGVGGKEGNSWSNLIILGVLGFVWGVGFFPQLYILPTFSHLTKKKKKKLIFYTNTQILKLFLIYFNSLLTVVLSAASSWEYAAYEVTCTTIIQNLNIFFCAVLISCSFSWMEYNSECLLIQEVISYLY